MILPEAFNRTLGAVDDQSGHYQYFNSNHAEFEIENWQIISPVNGFGYGVKEVNKFIQGTYRKSYIDLAFGVEGQLQSQKAMITWFMVTK